MWPLKATQVIPRNVNNREREKNSGHGESVDISVSSQESESVLEMTESWKMLSECRCLCRTCARGEWTGKYSEHTLSLDGSLRLRQPDLENRSPDSESQTPATQRRRRTTDLNGGEVSSDRQTHLGWTRGAFERDESPASVFNNVHEPELWGH